MNYPRLASLLLTLVVAVSVVFPETAGAQRREHRPYERARTHVEAVPSSAYTGHPRLAIILVIDQFRGDYLQRWRSDFKGLGFNLFLDHGAYFPDCYYNYANNETAPGHAAIATGAYTNGNGISADAWWDLSRNHNRPVSSVEDADYKLVGLPGASVPVGAGGNAPKIVPGASPRNLLASTIGDELRLATQGEAKIFGVSLKDRAAILSTGEGANGAFWIDPASGYFVTSSYYMQQLPTWAASFNTSGAIALAEQTAGATDATNFWKQVGGTPAANEYELEFAEALIQGEQLGQRKVTDLLTISLSANDLMGHAKGPDSADEEQMVDTLDTQLASFFTWLGKDIPGGLGNVWIALTADHGVAPLPETAAQYGLNAARIDLPKLIANLNYAMNMKFSPGEKIQYILPRQTLPYISLNEAQFIKDGINEPEAETAVQQALPKAFRELRSATGAMPSSGPETNAGSPGIQPAETRLPPRPVLFRSYTRAQLAAGNVPPTPWGRLIANSYSPNGGWYVMAIPGAYQMSASSGTTHFGPWSYDRHVPLAFWGAPFATGVYLQRVQPVDLAPTFAALLGVNMPSAAVGQVLTEALKPEGEVKYPRIEKPRSEKPRVRREAPIHRAVHHILHPAAHAAVHPAAQQPHKAAPAAKATHP